MKFKKRKEKREKIVKNRNWAFIGSNYICFVKCRFSVILPPSLVSMGGKKHYLLVLEDSTNSTWKKKCLH